MAERPHGLVSCLSTTRSHGTSLPTARASDGVHAVTPDLENWTQLPPELRRDAQIGKTASGSAAVDWHNPSGFGTSEERALLAFFTDWRNEVPYMAYRVHRDEISAANCLLSYCTCRIAGRFAVPGPHATPPRYLLNHRGEACQRQSPVSLQSTRLVISIR